MRQKMSAMICPNFQPAIENEPGTRRSKILPSNSTLSMATSFLIIFSFLAKRNPLSDPNLHPTSNLTGLSILKNIVLSTGQAPWVM